MEFKEVDGDLFTAPEEFHLAHCISSDAKMGAGIAVQFRKRFDLKILQDVANNGGLKVGSCHWVGRTLNLITKEKYWEKPTYMSMRNALESMRTLCRDEHIYRVAMPTIGAGLDKLNWTRVKKMIQEVFEDIPTEIVVYRLLNTL